MYDINSFCSLLNVIFYYNIHLVITSRICHYQMLLVKYSEKKYINRWIDVYIYVYCALLLLLLF